MLDKLERLEKFMIFRIFGKRRKEERIEVGRQVRRLAACWRAEPHFNGRAFAYSYSKGFAWKRVFGRYALKPGREANPHMVIVGALGYGKSTLLKVVIREVASMGKPIIVFDGHSEHEALVNDIGGRVHDASEENINMFELDGLTVVQRIDELTSLLSEVYALGYLQRGILSSALYYTYRKCAKDMRANQLNKVPVLADLIAELSVFAGNAKTLSERERIEHIRQRVISLQKCMPLKSHVGICGLSRGINSFSLSGIGNDDAKVIYITEAVKRLYTAMRANAVERGVRLYIIIDESTFLLDNAGKLLTLLVNEGRKFGYAVVIVTNSSAMVPRDIIANSATFIAFHINEPTEINYVSSVIAKGDQYKAVMVRGMLEMLRVNEVIISCSKGPVVVQTPRAQAAAMGAGDAHGKR